MFWMHRCHGIIENYMNNYRNLSSLDFQKVNLLWVNYPKIKKLAKVKKETEKNLITKVTEVSPKSKIGSSTNYYHQKYIANQNND